MNVNKQNYDDIIIEIQTMIDQAIENNEHNEQWFLSWLDRLNYLSVSI